MSIFDFGVKIRTVTLKEEFPRHDILIVYNKFKCILIDTEDNIVEKFNSIKEFRKCLGMDKSNFYSMYDKIKDNELIKNLESFYKIKIDKIYIGEH